ncbi:MAG: MBOAT family protein [Lachnospiraceae bacterium]|nr:MBOAT family protein [Lachnospiraceae bacterium]
MAFNSIPFLVFFPIVVLLYYAVPKKLKSYWLLIASYFFYMSWNAKYAILIALSTIITFFSGILIQKAQTVKGKKLVVAASFVSNISILVFFKYFAFLLKNLNAVLGLVHISPINNPFSFILPVGISFYTFQALSYTVDVYRGDVAATKNIVDYALFVSFFPQLVAGPIERSGALLSQIEKMKEKSLFDYKRFVTGFSMMLWGMFMKVVIADRISIFVDGVFGSLQAVGSVETLLGAFAFAFQIYCDFGGYSAIAIGAANVMGFTLCENFDAPYLSSSIAQFWRRWHISLSSWFRDYLYIPLGGNRKGKIRKYLNLFITFLVSGLWHGASWTYVLWGAIHGLYQIIGDLLKPVKKKVNEFFKTDTEAFSHKSMQIVVTFLLTSLAWVPFRAASISDTLRYFKCMFTRPDLWVLFNESLFSYGLNRTETSILLFSLMLLVAADFLKHFKKETVGEFLYRQNLWFRWGALIFLLLMCLVFGEYGVNFDSAKFIYFQF